MNHLLKLKRLYFSTNCSTKYLHIVVPQKQRTTTAYPKLSFAFFVSGSRNQPRFYDQQSAFHALQKTIQNINCALRIKHKTLCHTVQSTGRKVPTHKLDLAVLCHDINEYISLLRNKEFFYSENSSGISNRSMNPFKTA